jgi:hypothetical protein
MGPYGPRGRLRAQRGGQGGDVIAPSIRKLVWIAGVVLVLITAGVFAAVTYRGTPMSVTTLTEGWERRFKLEWTVEAASGTTRKVSGYITSQQSGHAEFVRLLVQAFDDKGAVVERRIWAIPGGVGGGQRAYFEVPDLPSAHEYRVYVWDYSLTQS